MQETAEAHLTGSRPPKSPQARGPLIDQRRQKGSPLF
jgi:hypothetical protein